MWEELRTAAFLQKSATGDPTALPAWEGAAGHGQARAMGYADGELGVLREGALADLIVVDLQKTPPAADSRRGFESGLLRQGCGCRHGGGRRADCRRKLADQGVDLAELYGRWLGAVRRITALG